MIGLVDWAASRARMVVAFVVLSIIAGTAAYVGLPKEGEPDIDIPGLFVSVPFPGISAADSERLLVRAMETEFQDLDGLTDINVTAAEGYAGIFLEFEFGWDKDATIAEVREAMDAASASFPQGAEDYSVNEINFSEFPILTVALSGSAPERTMLRIARDLQDRLEALPAVLEVGIAGGRDEMVEVVIDPLALESYNVTAQELIGAVVNNNQLIAAGEISTDSGALSVSIPASFDSAEDIFALPIKVNGDSVVTLGDLATIRLTYEDRAGNARYNGETTIALQVVKRLGFNIMDTSALVQAEVEAAAAEWPEELRAAVEVNSTLDQSVVVRSMVSQLEGSVLTAIALVMIVVLAALGTRSALLVGFAIPTSFLLCFILLGVMDVTISNMVMFGLILAVGMLVDGAIVVVEYADKRLAEGARPMQAYTDAAKRMFWPIVSSTATTLCAFLPMLFWPGVPGQFMSMLPITLIFVLSASLVVALIYLPVLGGVAARFSRVIEGASALVKTLLPVWPLRLLATLGAGYLMFLAALETISPGGFVPSDPEASAFMAMLPGMVMFLAAAALMSALIGSIQIERKPRRIKAGYRRTWFGWFIHAIVGNPVMPLVSIAAVGAFVVGTFMYFGENSRGVEFFVESEPENAIVYVRARGNLAPAEMDALVRQVEEMVLGTQGVNDVFAFSGNGGLSNNTGGADQPRDTIGQIQFDLIRWAERPTISAPVPVMSWLVEGGLFSIPGTRVDPAYDGDVILEELQTRLETIPGIETEIFALERGPASGKPVNLRLSGQDWDALVAATEQVRARFEATPTLTLIEDTLPLPGIEWQIEVDVAAAGRYGANVAAVGAMVQLVTRGILLDTMRVDSSDEEIEIRVRFPEEARVLSTLDTLRVRTPDGLVPMSNFITRRPVAELAEINRVNQARVFNIRADVEVGLSQLANSETGETWVAETAAVEANAELQAQIAAGEVTATPINANERIAMLTEWLETEADLPAGVAWEWDGDQQDQEESGAFLQVAFSGALGLMFIILLAQFNSIYNSVLVLLAVVLSTTGVLIGMLVMDQTFSIIMTGTGIVALAGIVVNNNIVLIDTFQEYSRYMPATEAITRTAEARIRPVLLTTITTMAGLMPMMFGISLDFAAGGYTVGSPTALWWIQLATAVVFGLGVATVLTLVFTPSLLALRVWAGVIMGWIGRALARLGARRLSTRARDWSLAREARQRRQVLVMWDAPQEEPSVPETPDAAPDEGNSAEMPPSAPANLGAGPAPDDRPPEADRPAQNAPSGEPLDEDGPRNTPPDTPLRAAE